MTKNFTRIATIVVASIASVLAVGCASVAVSNDAISQNTAQTLGLAPGSFTVSDRVDSGSKTTFNVRTSAGRQYSCYVTGSVSVLGRVVSDPLCTELGRNSGRAGAQPAAMPQPAAPAPQCNALLRAANRC